MESSRGFNLLNMSGGGTKIVGIASAAKSLLLHGYKPDIITGVSAGSYLALPLAMGYYDRIDVLLSKLTLDNMFDPKPVNEKGKITIASIYRILSGKYWIGDQRKSLELVRQSITEEEFGLFKLGRILCYVLSVDFRSGGRALICLNDCSYGEALEYILASGSIPFYTKGVDINSELLFDGGLRNHIASVPVIKQLIKEKQNIARSISIFSRPEDYDISEAKDWMPSDVSTTIDRLLDIMTMEISKSDEEMEQLLCSKYNIQLDQIFLPSVMEGTYDVDETRLRKLAGLSVIESLKVKI